MNSTCEQNHKKVKKKGEKRKGEKNTEGSTCLNA